MFCVFLVCLSVICLFVCLFTFSQPFDFLMFAHFHNCLCRGSVCGEKSIVSNDCSAVTTISRHSGDHICKYITQIIKILNFKKC